MLGKTHVTLENNLFKNKHTRTWKLWIKLFLETIVFGLFGATSVAPRRIFVLLNRYGRPNNEPKFFRTRLVKRPQTRLESAFLANLETLNSTKFSESVRNHSGVPSVPLKYTIHICTVCPKKLWVRFKILISNFGVGEQAEINEVKLWRQLK